MSQTTDTKAGNTQPQTAQARQAQERGTGRPSPEATANGDDLPTFLPAADIYDSDTALMMFMDVPGADPDGLDITLENRVLSVYARGRAFEPDGYTPLYAEFQTGNYRRAFALSDEVDREKIEASLKDGVLRLTLPKTTPAPAKKIPVKTH